MNAAKRLSLNELIGLDGLLSEEERMIRDTVRRYVRERFLPRAGELFERGEFPTELIGELAELGLFGASIEGYGCAGMNTVAACLAMQELDYGDGGLRSVASCQSSLVMWPIWRFGSEEQKQRLLPELAAGKLIGCFGLTEPDAGSDPAAMKARARRDGDDYVLSGTKMWITNAPIADIALVWAKVDEGDARSIRCFIVERGMKGFETVTTRLKMSLRASPTGELVLDEVRIPKRNMLPGAEGMKGPLRVLTHARFGIAWGALGAARACFDAAVDFTSDRVAFGAPIAAKQLIQEQLADIAAEIVKGQIMVLHYGRMKEATGRLHPVQVSLCKRNNVKIALEAARAARGILGASGISLDYPVIRHMLNLESVYTYEGTHEIHTLILGSALTGYQAF